MEEISKNPSEKRPAQEDISKEKGELSMNHEQIRQFLRDALASRSTEEGPAALSIRLEAELLAKGVELESQTGGSIWVAPDFSDIEVVLKGGNGQPLYATDQG